MDKQTKAQRLALLLECAEQGLLIKDIEGYEGLYAAISNGNIWSYYHNIFLSQRDNGQGYLIVSLYKNGIEKTKRVNRLIALAFVEKPDEWDESWDAAHIDSNRANNDYTNLKWQTRSDNMDTEHFRNSRDRYGATPVRCVETGIEYPTQAKAARDLDICAKSISNVINGYQHTAGGYHWERVIKEESGNEV